MRLMTTHFEQIPLAVVRKIASRTPKSSSSGVGILPGDPARKLLAARARKAAPITRTSKHPSVRGVT